MDDHPAKPGFFERLFGRLAGDSPDAGGATDAPAASTATEGNTK